MLLRRALWSSLLRGGRLLLTLSELAVAWSSGLWRALRMEISPQREIKVFWYFTVLWSQLKRKRRTAVLANGFGTAVLCWASIWRKPGINFILAMQLLFHGNVIWRDHAPLQGACPWTCTVFVRRLVLCLCGWAAKSRTAEKRCLLIGAFPSTLGVVCVFWGSLQLSSNSGNPGFLFCRRPEVLTSIEALG